MFKPDPQWTRLQGRECLCSPWCPSPSAIYSTPSFTTTGELQILPLSFLPPQEHLRKAGFIKESHTYKHKPIQTSVHTLWTHKVKIGQLLASIIWKKDGQIFKYILFFSFFFIYIACSAEAFFFAGCATVIILAISARFMLKKKAPTDPLFYGMNSLNVCFLLDLMWFNLRERTIHSQASNELAIQGFLWIILTICILTVFESYVMLSQLK